MKNNGKGIRVCGNYKITVNKYLKAQSDNLPTVDALMVADNINNNECWTLAKVRGVKPDR